MGRMPEHGGPAFPVYDPQGEVRALGAELASRADYGMTLRDWFAGQALVGMLANSQIDLGQYHLENGDGEGAAAEHSSVIAYQYADAMLEERLRLRG